MNSYKHEQTLLPSTAFYPESSTCTLTRKPKKKVVVDRDTAWNAKYQELVDAYKKQNGNLSKVKQSTYPTLYRWMVNQRNKRRAGKGNNNNYAPLTKRQIQLLDLLDFPWTPRNEWNDMYEELLELYGLHKDDWRQRVEYKSRLYLWMETQRRKRAGKPGYAPLSKEQIELLDKINFVWNPTQERQQANWYENYNKLADFYNKHGHLKVPSGSPLYTWMVFTQRRLKRDATTTNGTPSPLTQEQIRLLHDIDFLSWDPPPKRIVVTGQRPYEMAWHQKYQELVEFQREHGHLKVKSPSSLYTWMVTQRQKRAGKGNSAPLTDEQIQLLEDINFPWVPAKGGRGSSHHHHYEAAWYSKYQELVDFYKKHGHLKVDRPSPLYTWMSKQRSKWRRSSSRNIMKDDMNGGGAATTTRTTTTTGLTEEQIRLLNKLDFVWEPRRLRRLQTKKKEEEKIHF